MSTQDGTWPEPLSVPDHLLGRLRAAAEDRLERACDNGGEWNDEIRARVLAAARVVDAFDVAALDAEPVAELAEHAIELEFERHFAAPKSAEDLSAFVARFGICRELMAVRDAAGSRTEALDGSDGA